MTNRIITLTTIPSRFDKLSHALRSLLEQTDKVDAIYVYIPKRYRRFPEYDGRLPELPHGVELRLVDDDLGPATKVLYAAQDFAAYPDTQILFCDDDRAYLPDWAGSLFTEQALRPNECVSLSGEHLRTLTHTPYRSTRQPIADIGTRKLDIKYRQQRLKHLYRRHVLGQRVPKPPRRVVFNAGYADVLLGTFGAVVRPHFFDRDAFDIPDVLWTVDDIWLSGMLARKNIGIWVPKGLLRPNKTEAEDQDALYTAVINGTDRTEANRKCIRYMQDTWGIWTT